MATVTVEIDIARNGSITATPNPVFVRSGDRLFIHVRSNLSQGTQFNILFPGGTQSPFGPSDTRITVPARRCLGGGNGVDWPPQVNQATVTVSVSGSPVIGELEIDVLRADNQIVPIDDDFGFKPCLIQNFPIAGGPVAAPGAVGDRVQDGTKSTDCGPADVSAGPTWGPWQNTEDAAIKAALKRVRGACALQCGGKCDKGKCTYFERRSAVPDIESRTDERGDTTYRAQASSSGTCQCE